LSQRAGPYEVSVCTSPGPILVEYVDVSAMVQRPGGELVQDAQVGVSAKPSSAQASGPSVQATHDQATNKLFYAAPVAVGATGTSDVAL
jgi:hypothetical protein